MALPKLNHPTTTLTVPSSKLKVKVRPFTVKEEKILLMAQSSDDDTDKLTSMKQVIANCVLTPEFDADACPMFDIEYLFLKLRGFSVNNIIELKIQDEVDGEYYDLEIDINKMEVTFHENHNPQIELSDGVGIIMAYPSIDFLGKMIKAAHSVEKGDTDTVTNILFDSYARSIAKVWDEDGVYVAGVDFSADEASDFLETLPGNAFNKIQEFFDTMPSLDHEVTYMTKAGEIKSITLRGLQDFFP
jgi:T4 bacteriophage base plate protein.